MKLLQVKQGTPEWHAARAACLGTGSEASAMMGASKYMTRDALLRQKATGITEEITPEKQALFDAGHAAEAAARPLIESDIGDELYPATATDNAGRLLVSLDGMTMLGDTLWEHKLWSESLAAQVRAGELEPHYFWQNEHALLITGAKRLIFTVSDGTSKRRESMEYLPVPGRAEQLLAGWAQFETDLGTYVVQPAEAPAPVGRVPDSLPALHIELTGAVTESNLAEYRDTAIAVFRNINTDLQTDQDFADAEKAVKWCSDIEGRLKAAKDHALSQTQSIDALFKAIDSISAEARAKRLELDKLVKARKESLREDIVRAARDKVIEHFMQVNATLGEFALPPPATLGHDLNAAIRGMRSFSSMREAVGAVVLQVQIAASQRADAVRAAVAAFDAEVGTHAALFPDRVQLCMAKAPEDLRNLMNTRIGEHQRREQARIDAERARIRQEEQERADREARERVAQEQATQQQTSSTSPTAVKPCDPNAGETTPIRPDANGSADGLPAVGGTNTARTVELGGAARVPVGAIGGNAPAAATAPPLKLSEINAAIAPLSISGEGLASLGFTPVSTERAAKLYAASDFPAICRLLAQRLIDSANTQKAAA